VIGAKYSMDNIDCSSAQSTAGCNNGDDEVVDQIDRCTGLVDGKTKGWKYKPTHVSCFRL
jgi:hypothetical protein